MRIAILILCGIVILLPTSFEIDGGEDRKPDAVSRAFDEYEQLWRRAAAKGVEQLEAGTLKTDTATQEFLAKSGSAARRTAFETIAQSEEAAYWTEDENGERIRIEWTPERHAEILRKYVK